MAYAPGSKQAEAGGVASGGGSIPHADVSSIVGGLVSYTMASFWLFLAWAGFVIALGGLAGVQDLDGGSLLRFDWFTIFLLFIVLGLVTIALVTRELVRARIAVVAFLSIALVLVILSADRMHNLTDMYIGEGHYSGARCAFAGLVIAAIACFGLVYHLGITPLSI